MEEIVIAIFAPLFIGIVFLLFFFMMASIVSGFIKAPNNARGAKNDEH